MASPTPDPAAYTWVRVNAEWPGGDGTEYVAYPTHEWTKLDDNQQQAELTDMAEQLLQNSGCGAGASVVPLDEVPDADVAEALR